MKPRRSLMSWLSPNNQFCPGNLALGQAAIIVLGIVFAMVATHPVSAYTFKKLYDFCAKQNCEDGAQPSGLLPGSTGMLYGVTGVKGKYNEGNIFALTPNAGKYAFDALRSFCSMANCPDGADPIGELIADVDGDLYGTTFSGGGGFGVVFMLKRGSSGWSYKVVYAFCPQNNCANGGKPAAGLAYQGQTSGMLWDKSSPLFGTAAVGGSHGNGVVFVLTANGSQWNYTVIHNLVSGTAPNAPLVDQQGNLFVTDYGGGQYDGGVLFRLTKDTWHETTIHNFCAEANCADGEHPKGRVALDGHGNVFGVTETGGAGDQGVIFEHAASGGFKVIYDFCMQSNCPDGAAPSSLFFAGSGRFVGIATDGGAHEKGAVFSLVQNNGTWSESVVHSFCGQTGCSDGAYPGSSLNPDASGDLFGTTVFGGAGINCSGALGCGTAFELKP